MFLLFNIPSWSIPAFLHLLTERILSRNAVPEKVFVILALNRDWIVRFDGRHETVNDWFFFALRSESSEKTVPNNQNRGVVLVDAVRIATVVHAMMTS